MINLGKVIEIKTNKNLENLFEKYFNYSRYSFNKALETYIKYYKNKKPASYQSLRNDSRKFVKGGWRNNIPKNIFETSVKDVFENRKTNIQFKEKNKSKKSFRFQKKDPTTIVINDNYLKIPKTPKIKLKEDFDSSNKDIKEVTISKIKGKYYASINYELLEENFKDNYAIPKNDLCGLDVGVRTLGSIFDNNGEYFIFESRIDELEKLYRKSMFYEKVLSRKEYNSKNYIITINKYDRVNRRIKNIIKDSTNKLTTFLCKNYKNIVIEDLDVRDMMKKKKSGLGKTIRRNIGFSSFYEIRRQLEYKKDLFGNNIIKANKWYPSTQLCPICEKRTKIGSRKIYKCNSCGHKLDRDINAAINLYYYPDKFGVNYTPFIPK